MRSFYPGRDAAPSRSYSSSPVSYPLSVRRPSLLVVSVAVAGLVIAAAVGADLAAPVAVPGTRVVLESCPGFETSSQFAGVVHQGSNASILVSEVESPVAQMRLSLTRERLEAGGLTVHESEEVRVGDHDATLVHASQLSSGNPFRKWLLVLGDDANTVSLIATVPAQNEAAIRDGLMACLLNARWDPTRTLDLFEGLGFRVRETEALRVSDRVSGMVFFTRPQDGAPPRPGEPVFIVGAWTAKKDVTDLSALARRNVQRIAEVKEVSFVSEKPLVLDGVAGVETVADAHDFESGAPLVVYQAIAVEEPRQVFMMQGLVGVEGAERYLPEFRAVAASFERVAGGAAP